MPGAAPCWGFCTWQHFTAHSKPGGLGTSLQLILTDPHLVSLDWMRNHEKHLLRDWAASHDIQWLQRGSHQWKPWCKKQCSWQHKSKDMFVCQVSHSQRTLGTSCGVIENHDSCYYPVLAKGIALV